MGGIRHGYWLCFALLGGALAGCTVKVSTNNGAGGASGASGSGAGTSQGGSSTAGAGGTAAGAGGSTAGTGGTAAGAGGSTAGTAGAAGKGGAGAGAGGAAGSGGSTAGAAGTAGTGGTAMASNKGLSGFPASCSAAPADDACMSCVRTSCCTQIQACNDGSCHDAYASFLGCRFDATGAETGFSTNYCVNDTKLASTPAAKALEQCFVDKCMATACAKPEQKTTWSTFADEFVEQFCVGCHFPNDKGLPPKASASSSFPVGPTGQKLTIFNSDVTWGNWGFKTPCSFGDCGFNPPTDAMPPKGDMPEPAANPDWPSLVDPDGIAKKKDVIVCGVHPTKLMPGCENIKDDVLPANFFHMKGTMDTGAPVLKKFPPKGDGTDHFGSPNPCWWADDASPPLTQGKPTKGTCVQPTDHDRARFVSWILDGMAKLAGPAGSTKAEATGSGRHRSRGRRSPTRVRGYASGSARTYAHVPGLRPSTLA